MLTDAELREMRARCEAATPGPWKMHHRFVSAKDTDDECAGLGWDFDPDCPTNPPEPMLRGVFARAADAHFLMSARTDMPRLIDEVERLREQVRMLREVLTHSSFAAQGQKESDVVEAVRAAARNTRAYSGYDPGKPLDELADRIVAVISATEARNSDTREVRA